MSTPFKAEYAKSSRSSCRGCKDTIEADTLRIAKMVQSFKFDGMQPNWFHFKCFFDKTKTIPNTACMEGFDALRWEDQERIRKHVDVAGPATASSRDLLAEYAKSSRATCLACDANIDKDEVRLGVMMDAGENQDSSYSGPAAQWYHQACFVRGLDTHTDVSLALLQAASFLGHANLSKEDNESINEMLDEARKAKGLPVLARAQPAAKGGKRKDKEPAKTTKKTKLDPAAQALKDQADLLWKLRDALSALSKSELHALLEHNDQRVPPGVSALQDACADGMAFGALKPCATCKHTHWELQRDGYHCKGQVNEWQPCTVVDKTPARAAWKIPAELKTYEGLKSYKYTKRDRVFDEAELAATEAAAVAVSKATAAAAAAAPMAGTQPLDTLFVAVVGKLSQTHGELQSLIESLGGTFVGAKLGPQTTCLIANDAEVKKNGKKVQEANALSVPIVRESFLTECRDTAKLAKLQDHLLHCAGPVTEPVVAVKAAAAAAAPSTAGAIATTGPADTKSTKSAGKSQPVKMIVKGRAAVDPESELAESHHVLEEGNTIWNASLSLVDLREGLNSYYKLQVLIDDKTGAAVLFRAWGRTGTGRGGKKVDGMPLASAKSQFIELFHEKTGNTWGEKNPEKHPGKFFPLDIDYGVAPAAAAASATTSALKGLSKLPTPVQDLVSTLFDVKQIQRQMCEMDLDVTKMPLGKLSRRQLESAYEVLNELQTAINSHTMSAAEKKGKILAGTTHFYTLVPHAFGPREVPLIDNPDLLVEKIHMIDDLLDIEVAARLLEETVADTEHPIDAHYRRLQTHIVPVDRHSDEYKLIEEYTANTHAPTHSQYHLEIEQVFKIDRKGERDRFKDHEANPNRRLLWHGSRMSNYVGILSEGLRIAPPSAPVSGYMFGKGVYFADMVSKSANYCFTSQSNDTGFLLLAEVALGTMQTRTAAHYVDKLSKGYQSTLGQGRTLPDPSNVRVLEDGVIVPLGKPTTSTISSSLLYNEYIVYDTSQINLKYLIKMKFDYSRRR